jgi:multidrug efflux pump subunit AcrB
VTIESDGLDAKQQKALHQLALVLKTATAAMFLVLVWEFGRLAPAIAVLVGALSCRAGSFGALDLTGVTLNVSSFMGIIMVAESRPRTVSCCWTMPSATLTRAWNRARR